MSGSVREHRSFVIIAISVERIDIEILPRQAVDFILTLEKGCKIYEYGHRFSRNIPTPYPYRQTGIGCGFAPNGIEALIFCKIRILFVFPNIRTNEYEVFAHRSAQNLGARRKDGVDAAHFVADFPAAFKNVIGLYHMGIVAGFAQVVIRIYM
mgnify:CR=1 FL=1